MPNTFIPRQYASVGILLLCLAAFFACQTGSATAATRPASPSAPPSPGPTAFRHFIDAQWLAERGLAFDAKGKVATRPLTQKASPKAHGGMSQLDQLRAQRQALGGWNRDSLTMNDQIDYDYLAWTLDAAIGFLEHPNRQLPVVFPTPAGDVLLHQLSYSLPLSAESDIEPWLQVLGSVPAALQAGLGELRARQESGTLPSRMVLSNIADAIDYQVLNKPTVLWEPVRVFAGRLAGMAALSDEERARHQQRLESLIDDQVRPCYREIRAAIRELAAAAPPGYTIFPGESGKLAYAALLRQNLGEAISPEEVVRRAQSKIAELDAEFARLFPEGEGRPFARAMDWLNRQQVFTSSDRAWAKQVLDESWLISQQWFSALPRPFQVVMDAPTNYPPNYCPSPNLLFPGDPEPLSADGLSRYQASIHLPASSFMNPRSSLALLSHEGLPGHALQAGLQRENQSLAFVRRANVTGAFSEGWAVYASELMADTPRGRDKGYQVHLMTLLYRHAVSAAIDAGVNGLAWGYKEVQSFINRTEGPKQLDPYASMIRPMYWPTQECFYFIGYHQIMGLRTEMQAKLGDAFKLKDFHDQVLSQPGLPIHLLRKALAQASGADAMP